MKITHTHYGALNNMAIKLGFNFVPMPQEIWDNGWKMTLGEFCVLGYLIRHTVGFRNDCVRLSHDELAYGRKKRGGERIDAGCGITGRTNIRSAIEALVDKGAIKVEEDASDPARIKRYYSVNINTEEGGGSKTDHQMAQIEPSDGSNQTPVHNKDNSDKTTSKKQADGGYCESKFDEWYSIYPRKKNKGTARLAFKSALKKVSFDELIKAVKSYKALVDSGKVERKYVPHPSSWLNGEAWGDEDETQAKAIPEAFRKPYKDAVAKVIDEVILFKDLTPAEKDLIFKRIDFFREYVRNSMAGPGDLLRKVRFMMAEA